jgi:uncharacterized protein YcbK (DUF882 family)
MQLTRNFNSKEFVTSTLHPELLAEIKLNDQDILKLFYICRILLQPVRDIFGRVRILSGKRSLRLNNAIGGSPSSDHLYTRDTPKCAVDFTLLNASTDEVFRHLRDTRAGTFGQLIYYPFNNFIHISLPNESRLGEVHIWQNPK